MATHDTMHLRVTSNHAGEFRRTLLQADAVHPAQVRIKRRVVHGHHGRHRRLTRERLVEPG